MIFLYSVIAILFAVAIHESAHAWAADRLGDPTGRLEGRISLNPFNHLDLFGTFALVFFGIGWGKPVPFNPVNLHHPKRDSALIALAGPLSNLLCAILVALPLKYLSIGATSVIAEPLFLLLKSFFSINVLLFSLNMLPFPPLDGSKIVGILVPHRYRVPYAEYLHHGVKYFIIFVIFDVIVLERVFEFSILRFMVTNVSSAIITLISLGT